MCICILGFLMYLKRHEQFEIVCGAILNKIYYIIIKFCLRFRGFYWANYSTGLGSSLHELGHTFDLAHTRTGIMARGFDDLYRVFTIRPLRSRASSCSRDSSRLTTPSPYSSRSRSRVRSQEEHSEKLSSFYGCGFVIYLFILFIYLISK